MAYHEIQPPPQRYSLIDKKKLIELTGMEDGDQLQNQTKQMMWVESVAVGSESFVLDMKEKMGSSVLGRKTSLNDDIYTLREPESAHHAHLGDGKLDLSIENTVCFDETL